VTEIAIQFKPAPLHLFNQDGGEGAVNLLILRIQPEEGISLEVSFQASGDGHDAAAGSMDFNYGSSFGNGSLRV